MGSFDFGSGEERDKDILLEINKLKDRFEELNSNFVSQEKTMDKFSTSLDKLNDSFQKLTSVLERAEQLVKNDSSDTQMKTLLKQNKEVAHGIIGVGELIKQQQKDMLSLRELAEQKLNDIKIQPTQIEKPAEHYEEPKSFTPPPIVGNDAEITQEPGYLEKPDIINEKIQAEFDATAPRETNPQMPSPTPPEIKDEFPAATEFVNDDEPDSYMPSEDSSSADGVIPPPPKNKSLFSKFKK